MGNLPRFAHICQIGGRRARSTFDFTIATI